MVLPLLPEHGIAGYLSLGRLGEWDRDPVVGRHQRATSIRYGLTYAF